MGENPNGHKVKFIPDLADFFLVIREKLTYNILQVFLKTLYRN